MTQARDRNAVENRVKSIDPTRAAACSHFVILLIDEETGDADAFGPLDEDAASREADTLRAHLKCSEELAEVRLMVVPLVEVDLRRCGDPPAGRPSVADQWMCEPPLTS